MAKRILSWKNEGCTLFCGKAGESEVVDWSHSFNLEEIYPGFNGFTPVQKYICFYGLKQVLADCGSQEKGFDEKMVLAVKKWKDFKAGRVATERSNGTGAAENKKLASEVKNLMKAVTLEGLLIKKTLNPGLFSEEDEAKLQEFMQAAVKLASQNTANRLAKK